jgi:cytoskeleton protein RodZ
MASIGDALRNERLRRGLTFDQVADETKICPCHLKSMEAGRFDRLPCGIFFRRSFLRQYAHTLGLDEEELIESLNQQYQPANPSPEPQREHRPWHVPRLPGWVWLLAILVYAGDYSVRENRRSASPSVWTSAVPPRGREGSSPSASGVAPDEPRQPAYRDVTVSNGGTGQTDAGDQGAVQETAPAMRVTFTATEPVWISIKSDDAYVYGGMLAAQQSKEVEACHQMRVLIGNAGRVEISINGTPVGPLGERGEVELVELTPKGARVVPRAKIPPPPSGEGDSVSLVLSHIDRAVNR